MKRTAVVVGTDRYRDAQIHDLRYAVEDARRVANALENGGFHTRFLHDAPDRRVVEAVDRMVAGLGPEDLFVLYFSGHGVSVNDRHLLLCEDARQTLLRHGRGGVWVDELKELTAIFGGHRVLILDTCREPLLAGRGAVAQMRNASALRTLVREENEASRPGGLTILCSCDENDTAQESETLGQGLFSRALIECLTDATRGASELRLDGALAETLATRMRELAAQTGLALEQRPWVQTCGIPAVLIPQGGEEPARPAPPPTPPTPEALWYVSVNGQTSSGMSLPKLKAEIAAGRLLPTTPVWGPQLGTWTPAENVPELAGIPFPTATLEPSPALGAGEVVAEARATEDTVPAGSQPTIEKEGASVSWPALFSAVSATLTSALAIAIPDYVRSIGRDCLIDFSSLLPGSMIVLLFRFAQSPGGFGFRISLSIIVFCLAALAAVLFLCWSILQNTRRPREAPPGPWWTKPTCYWGYTLLALSSLLAFDIYRVLT